jgi:transposase
VEEVILPEEKECPCCNGALHCIDSDVSSRLDVIRERSIAFNIGDARGVPHLGKRALLDGKRHRVLRGSGFGEHLIEKQDLSKLA